MDTDETAADPFERLVERFGSHPGPNRSTRFGHWPLARRHVESAILHHQGVPAKEIARQTGRGLSAVYWSIARGRELLARGLARGAWPVEAPD